MEFPFPTIPSSLRDAETWWNTFNEVTLWNTVAVETLRSINVVTQMFAYDAQYPALKETMQGYGPLGDVLVLWQGINGISEL